MGLWDAISGKNIRFNQVQREANSYVCKVLQSFVTSRLERYPSNEKMFLDARNELYAFYMSSSVCIAHSLEHDISGYKDPIISLDKTRYLQLVSSLHVAYIVSEYLSAPEEPGARSWFYLVSEGVCDIYARPDSFMEDWIESFTWLSEDGKFIASRLYFKAFDEFLDSLNLDAKERVTDVTIYGDLLRMCVSNAGTYLEDPNWGKIVDREIAAQ
jgi:hypothetical protein